MCAFRAFERKVVKTLVSRRMSVDQVTAVLDSASLVSCEHTGVGYFLTVRHPSLPSEKIVCSEPLLVGKSADVECGFVVFLEDGELTLECHTLGSDSVPEDFRERQVEIEPAT